jgi:hypothetical protein
VCAGSWLAYQFLFERCMMLRATFLFVSCFDRERARVARSNGCLPNCAVASAFVRVWN